MSFTDSNVWFYCYSTTGDELKRSKALRLASENDICLSSQVINELVSNLIRKAKATDSYIQNLIEYLYSDYLVLEILKEDILTACELRIEYNFSYWDSLIVATALRANADTLYSEDMHDGLIVRDRLTIRNPFRA